MDKSKKVGELRELVERRFVHKPWGYLLDCARPDGSAEIPTPDECRNGIPNVLGWGTSNENGAFFTGLYLYGLCNAYLLEPSDELKAEIMQFCDGLFRLCDIAVQDGCIARGVADDGVSHYPFSSEDQAGPHMLGLWKLMNSPLADDELKAEIERRLVRTLKGIINAGWNIPTEWEGVTRGTWAHADWRGASKLIFFAKLAEQLGLINSDEFERLRDERPDGGFYTRYEICACGFAPDMLRNTGLIQFWIDVCAQLCIKELIQLDPDYSEYYRSGLSKNADSVYWFLDDYKKYDNAGTLEYNHNWRELIAYMLPERRDADEAMREAGSQIGIWNSKLCPRMMNEHRVLGNMLFGAWIALASSGSEVRRYAAEKLYDALDFVDWNTLHRSYAFAAIAAYYQSLVE